jgi:hypothetical protein
MEFLERDETPDGVMIYPFASESREGLVHHTIVDLGDSSTAGITFCDCDDARYRHIPAARAAKVKIDISQCFYHCKHQERAIRDCIRRGDIQLLVPKSRGVS